MKKLLFILLFFVSLNSYSQLFQSDNKFGTRHNREFTRFSLGIPNDTFAVEGVTFEGDSLHTFPHIAAILTDLYIWNTTAKKWDLYAPGSSGGPFVAVADTAAMLANYRHWLAGYMLYTDTAAMLANYRHWLEGYIKNGVSLGAGLNVFAGKNGDDLEFNTMFASDFDLVSNEIKIDYSNGQAASNTNKGFLTAADWIIFNSKVSTGLLTGSGLTMNTARILGRTTAGAGAIEEIQIGTGLDLTSGVLSSTVSAGEVNTASNLGGGLANYSTKVGVDLRFNSFLATDFDLVSNVIGIDYTNGQAANGSTKGFLTAADWNTFNSKIGAGSVIGNGLTMNTDRILGRTTAGSGAIEEITIGSGLQLSGGALIATGSGGEINTASNIGGGLANWDSKVGVDLKFNTFLATDFDLTSNVIGIDYTNGQASSGSTKGFLTSTDWNTFNNKVGTGVITGSGLTMSTARMLGRTTAGTGAVEEITIGTGLSLSAGTLTATTNGEANTASNLGGALGVWDSKSGVDLRFNSFLAADFDLASNVFSIDYTNGQAASGSAKGFLTSADWTAFNNKIGTGTIVGNGQTMNTARMLGRTTAGIGGIEEITIGTGLSLSAGTLTATTTGEANTASNLGGGLANWDSKSGVDLRFNTFTSSDFNLASNLISIDYTNGQSASGSTKGFLTSADWTTFNNKVGTGLLTGSGLTMNTARILGRTTASAGAVEEIVIGTGLTLAAGTLSASSSAPTLDQILGATGSASRSHGSNPIVWDWQTISTQTGISFLSSSTAAASGSQNVVTIGMSGNNANASQLTTSLYVYNTHGGTTPDNYAARFDASGGSNNTAIYIGAGNFKHSGSTSGTVTVIPQAVAGTPTITYPNTSGTIAVGASSPLSLSSTTGNLTIADADAVGNKGASTYTASDFNVSSGLVSIDYTNGQASSGSTKGFLTSTDWTTFNNKVGTGLLTGSGLTMSTARILGRTTAGTGAIEEITIGTGLSLSAGTLISTVTAGETNTASNLGGGLANWDSKSGVDLRFNTFTASDFNLASNLISIDYANGQAATSGQKGFLTSADWSTFNSKIGAGSIIGNGLTMNTARMLGRTTAGSGAIEEITIGTGLSLSAGTLTATTTGEANTASNLGGGLATWDSKSGVDLRFNTHSANDFNLASNLITIDYVNGQVATSGQNGFLSSANWTTFNNKVGTGLITGSGLTMNTARILGRTTASSGAIEEITIGSGLTLSGGTLSSSVSAPTLDQVLGATGTATRSHANNPIVWNWQTLASQTGISFLSNSTAAAGGSQNVVTIGLSGNNATSSQLTTSLYVYNTHGGTAPDNYAARFDASGGSNNTAVYIGAGNFKHAGSTSGVVTVIPQATAGTPTLTFPNTSGTFAVGATTPLSLSSTTGNLTIADADAAGGKGASTYTAADFNVSSGLVSIDYVNGTAATSGQKGFLTSTDWSTFNSKVGAGAITGSGLTMSTARILGRTTGGSGAIEEITIGAGLSLSGGTLSNTGITGSGTSGNYPIFNGSTTVTNGAITQSGNVISFGNYQINGFASSYENQTGTTFTLTNAETGKIVTLNNSSPITLTIPTSLVAGFNCTIVQKGTGQITVSASGTTINNSQGFTKSNGQYSAFTIIQYDTNTFLTQGNMSN